MKLREEGNRSMAAHQAGGGESSSKTCEVHHASVQVESGRYNGYNCKNPVTWSDQHDGVTILLVFVRVARISHVAWQQQSKRAKEEARTEDGNYVNGVLVVLNGLTGENSQATTVDWPSWIVV